MTILSISSWFEVTACAYSLRHSHLYTHMGLNVWNENRSATSEQWCADTCKSDLLWQCSTLYILWYSRRWQDLQSLSSGSSHSESQNEARIIVMFQVFKPCLGVNLTSIPPLSEPLIGTSSFHHETTHGITLNLLNVHSVRQTPRRQHWPWNHLCPWGVYSLPPRGSKFALLILSHVAFLLFLLLKKVIQVLRWGHATFSTL